MILDFTDRISGDTRSGASLSGAPAAAGEDVYERVEALAPKDERQRDLRNEALHILVDIGKTRSLMYYQGLARPSRPLMIAIVFWLTLTFFSWGLYARPNATVVLAIAMAALAVASALLVIGEMYSPYEGLIRVSTVPLRAALATIGR